MMAFVISAAVPSLVLSADVAERRLSEQHYRELVEHANDIVATLDLEFRFVSVNPAAERILGYTSAEMIGTPLAQYVPPEQLATHAEMLRRKLQGAEVSTRYEIEISTKSKERRVLEVNSKLIADPTGKPVGIHAIARDISDRKEGDARQLLLVRELQHRTKNILAVIQAITTMTLKGSKDLDSAQETLTGRLHALSHAQDFVAKGPGGGASLRDLLRAELSSFESRIEFAGPEIVLGGSFAQNFALLVHELVTNSVKHGALKGGRGRVVIRWWLDEEEEATLRFSWVERDGPQIAPPERKGMGTMLMTSVGKSNVAYHPTGLEYELRMPLSEVVVGSS
jgi:PAS domain S-box-containing protein